MRDWTGKRSWLRSWYRPVLGLGLVVGTAFAVGLLAGLQSAGPRLVAAPPPPNKAAATPAASPKGGEPSAVSSDYARRVVARIHGNIEVTREELGEWLIARYGADKLELLVNRKMIDHACREKGVSVTDAEVEAALIRDIGKLGVSRDIFLKQVLKQYHTTLFEWKEDVLRPQLLLAKLCQDRVEATDGDIRNAFEYNYGEKVEVRILLYPESMQQAVFKIYEKIRGSDEEFIKAAREQPNSNLAMTAGVIKPISRFSTGDVVEKTAFSLHPGEISEVIETPEGILVMKCLGRKGPNLKKIFENEREVLKKEVIDRKIQLEIPKVFAQLKEKAQPVRYLNNGQTMEDLEKQVRPEIEGVMPPFRNPAAVKPPQAN